MRFFTLFTTLGIFLCITVAGTAWAKNSDLPDWVETPPTDNASAIYGIGTGPDLDSAKKQALADVAGKLSTRISSEIKIYQKMVNGKVDDSFQSTVSASTEGIELSHYQVEHSARINDEFWVLLAVSLPEFIALKKQQLLEVDQALQLLMQRFGSHSDLQRFVSIPEINAKLKQAVPLIATLRATSDFNSKPYDTRYNTYRDEMAKTRDRLKFAVSSDDGGRELAADIVDLLSDAGLNAKIGSNGTALINISTEIQSSESDGATRIIMNSSIATRDTKGNTFGSRQYYSRGRSYSGYDAALRLASGSAASRIKTEGVVSGLGLKLEL